MPPAQTANIQEVSIFGTDGAGKAFFETARARFSGAEVTLEGLSCRLKPNDVVGLRAAGQKTRFRVVWVGGDGTPQEGQAGLRSLEAEKSAGMLIERPVREPKSSLAGSERRRHTRIPCRGRVEFRRQGSDDMDIGRLQLLSEGGCYVATLHTPPPFSPLNLLVNAEGLELQTSGEVRDSHEGYGMGIAFGEMNEACRSRLSEWISRHSG